MRSRILLLILAAVAIPACKANQKLAAPMLVNTLPSVAMATGISFMPNILLEFDRPMDDAFMSDKNNFALIPGAAPSSIPFNVQHIAALNQVRIIPSSLLAGSTQYTVLVSGLVKSAAGTPIGSTTGFQFNTKATTTTTSTLSWAGITSAVTGASANQIDLVWPSVQESAGAPPALGDVAATYNIYVSTVSGSEDLLSAPIASPTSSGSTVTITLPASNTLYFIKIQPVDGDNSVYTDFTTFAEVQATSK
jgi:hypothetical protein